MRKEILFKLLQRHTYTCLSHQYGIYFAFAGLVIVVYSMFQFGEELLEWSQHQYDSVFSSYHDNIAARSFQYLLSAPLPIDVVYTWVNGSDPALLLQLNALKLSLNSDSLSNTTGARDDASFQCTFKDCLVLPCLVATTSLNVDSVTVAKEKFQGLSDLKYIEDIPVGKGFVSNIHQNVSVLRFENKNKLAKAVTSLEKNGNNTFRVLYVTTEKETPNSTPLGKGVILSAIPDKMTSDDLLSKLPKQLKDITEWIHVSGGSHLAFVWTKNPEATAELFNPKGNTSISSFAIGTVVVSASPAYAVVKIEEQTQGDMARSRFEDNEELRYSIRSVEKYAPWIRRIYIVTNGQIPYWLDLDNPRIFLVTHEEIFPNKSHLPTFSSPAIEAHIHRINGLAKRFIYMNDDVMFGKEVWPEDFFTHSFGHKVYLTWPVPNCADGCAPSWIKDGFCDAACNISECNWDGGDCTGENVRAGVGVNANGGYSYSRVSYCFPGCADSWIADKFCDQSCNKEECAFDGADCGISEFGKLYKIKFRMENGTTFHVPHGIKTAYIDISKFFKKVIKAQYIKDKSIRTAAVSNKYHVMTIIYNTNGNQSNIHFQLVGEPVGNDTAKNAEIEIGNSNLITVMFNVTAFPSKNVTLNITELNKENKKDAEKTDEVVVHGQESKEKKKGDGGFDFSDIVSFPEHVKKPKFKEKKRDELNVILPEHVDLTLLPANVSGYLNELENDYKHEILTSFGYRRKKIELLLPYISILKSSNASIMSQKETKVNLTNEVIEEVKVVKRELPSYDSHVSKERNNLVAKLHATVTQEFLELGHEHNKGDVGEVISIREEQHPEYFRKVPADPEQNLFYQLTARKNLTNGKDNPGQGEEQSNINAENSIKNTGRKHAGRKLLHWFERRGSQTSDKLDRILHSQPRISSENGFLPWEKRNVFSDLVKAKEQNESREEVMKEYEVNKPHITGRKPLDTFADSLRYVSNIFNKDFGFTQRKVPAHMPHFIDKDIMIELQVRYAEEFAITSSHKLRHSKDMQFAFTYNYYLMSVTEPINLTTIFHSLDSDHSGILSDRELRLLATRTHTLPLTLDELTNLEKKIISCAWDLYGPEKPNDEDANNNDTVQIGDDTVELKQPLDGLEPWAVTESYYDSSMPLVTEHLFLNCPFIVDLVNKSYSAEKKYKFEIMEQEEIAFKMIRSNVSIVVGQLDDIRKNPKKFICLNDNIDHHNAKDAEMVKAVLRDFYETVFPKPSQFELPADYRNRFLDVHSLKEWRDHRDNVTFWMRTLLCFLLMTTFLSLTWDWLVSRWGSHRNRLTRILRRITHMFSRSRGMERRKMSNV